MKNLTIIMTASVLALSALTTTGCAVATAGVKKGDERNFARSLNDVNAGRAIRARMSRAEGFKLKGVDVEVAEGVVLLSGNVPRPEDRIEAERIAWSADRVIQIGNEITIKDKQGHMRNAKDGFLHQSVRARLIANKNIKARNFNLEVHDGKVYLLGVARSQEELALAAHTVSTTKGTREVVSYVKINGDSAAQYANGPGYNGQPSSVAANRPTYTAPAAPSYTPQAQELPPIQDYSAPIPYTPPAGAVLDDDAIDSGEPYYLDPQTGERIEIPEGVKPIPYTPDTGPGSLGAGGTPIPPGALASLPSDDQLGKFRAGAAGQAVSVIESAPYTLDPTTGEMVPVKFENGLWIPQIIK